MSLNINARVKHKHDVEANWQTKSDFVPLAGELVIYNADESNDKPRLKIGDGVSDINELPFFTAPIEDTVSGFKIQKLAQESYDALSIKDPNTLYIIV